MKGIKDAIGVYSTEKGHSIWVYLTENDEMLQTTDFWDEEYDPPQPADPDNPIFMEKYEIEVYDKDYTGQKMFRLKAFHDEESFGHSLYNIVKLQTSPAVWNDAEATVDFTQMARSRCVITLLRKLTVICQRDITGQRTDAIVDSLETVKKTLCYRQPNNKSPAKFAKDLKESFRTAVEVGGTDAFGRAAMREAIADGVRNGMTANQYFDTALNTDDNQRNRSVLFESFKQRIVARLLVMNCKHKSVRNNIQHTQTHMRPNAAGVVESAWPNDISKAILMLMIHEDMQKQKKNGGGGSQNKKTNPKRNRGGGTNNTEANVSVTNAAGSLEVECDDALDTNQDRPNAEMASKDPTPTDNGGDAAVWFVLSSVGDKFDDSIDDDII